MSEIEFCTCINPIFVDDKVSEQNGGDIRDMTLGKYCTECNKPKAPKKIVNEDDN